MSNTESFEKQYRVLWISNPIQSNLLYSSLHVAETHLFSRISGPFMATSQEPPVQESDEESRVPTLSSSTHLEMAGIGCFCSSSILPFRSNLASSLLVAGIHPRGTIPHRRRSLTIKAEVSYVNAEEAKKLIAVEGYAILDVRDNTQFNRAHIKDCYHVPLFIENDDNDLGTIIKRTVHNNFSGLFFGLPFTKPNPNFVQSVKAQFSPESKLLLVCQEGLRSAGAVTKLEQAGYQNLACITSGLQSVKPGTFDSVGPSELQNAGKAGLVTVQGKISAVLGTVLICAYLFITFFPDQAEKLLQLAPSS